MSKKRILFVGTYLMPDRTPSALRALGIALSLRGAGYECEFGAAELWEKGAWLPARARSSVKGFKTEVLGEFGGGHSSRWSRAAVLLALAGREMRSWLSSSNLRTVAAVISLGGYTPQMLRLQPLLRRHRVPLLADIADWYDPWHCPGGPFAPYWWQIEFAMRVLYKRCSGIIAVSSFLRNYYNAPGRPAVRVPPTTDTTDRKWLNALICHPEGARVLRLVYAGTPGKKDDMGAVIEAIVAARNVGRAISLTVVGPSRDDVMSRLPRHLHVQMESWTTFTGRIEHEQLPRTLAKNDFSILMRQNKRYANAGFPTKLVESLCSGVPVIANATSDIKEYVRDGVEGFIVRDNSVDALVTSLVTAADTAAEIRRSMRQAARSRAIECFDYRGYTKLLARLVEGVQLPHGSEGG